MFSFFGGGSGGGNGSGKGKGKGGGRKVRPQFPLAQLAPTVLTQVHGDQLTLAPEALAWFLAFGPDMANRICAEAGFLEAAGKKLTVSSRSIQTAVRLVLPGELAKHAVSEGVKAVTKACAYDDGYAGSGLTLNKTAARKLVVDGLAEVSTHAGGKFRIGMGAPIYLSAVVEYLMAEILELSGNAARDDNTDTITVLHISKAILGDEELLVMLGAPGVSAFMDPMGEGVFHPVPSRLAGVRPAASVEEFCDINDEPLVSLERQEIRNLPMQRLIREIAQDYRCDLKFRKDAISLIHAAMEAFVISLFESARLTAVEYGRTTITHRDLREALYSKMPTPGMMSHYHTENNPGLAPILAEEMRKEQEAGTSGPSRFY